MPFEVGTRYYLADGGVARSIVTPEGSLELALWSPARKAWVAFPDLFGKIYGIGGDGHYDQISREDAAAIIAKPVAP